MTKEEYLIEVIELVSQDKTVEALNLLEECARGFDLDDLYNFVILNQARITRIKESGAIGVVDSEEYKIECNRINAAILESIEVLREEEKDQQRKDAIRYGRIAHNIPPVMSKGIARMCKVRIAHVDELLYDTKFKKENTSAPEPLEITDVMEVELYDPSGGQFFLVEAINREIEQPVEDHAHTEWKFRVTPLIVGAHELELRAFLHKQKGTKELSFETQIEVVAYDGEFYAKHPLPAWKTDEQVINFVKDEDSKAFVPVVKKNDDDPTSKHIDIPKERDPAQTGKSKLFPFLSAGLAKAASVIAVTLLIGTSGYFTYRYFISSNAYTPPSDPELLKASLKVDTQLHIQTIRINSVMLADWTANPDSSEIHLAELRQGIYYILVEGTNGKCEKWISLNRASTIFEMGCYIANPIIPVIDSVVVDDTVKVVVPQPPPPPPPVKTYKVNIITPFAKATIQVNGNKNKSTTSIPLEENKFRTTLTLPGGKHTIIVSDQAKTYSCQDSIRKVDLKKNTELSFDCTIPLPSVDTFTVTYTIIDIRETPTKEVIIFMDEKIVKDRTITPKNFSKGLLRLFRQTDLVIEIKNVPEGKHTFQVQLNCNYPNGKKIPLKVSKDNTRIEDQGDSFPCIH